MRQWGHRAAIGLWLLWGVTFPALGHDAPDLVEARIAAHQANVAGTLMLPHLEPGDKVPCVVILGGMLSDTRDGRMNRPGAPPRDALKRLAEALVVGGYASLRYDKVGHGESRPQAGWRGTYTDEAEVAAAAIAWVRRQPRINHVIVAGESAGAYLACLAARQGVTADAYVFLGPLCGSVEELYGYNFGRLVEYADQDTEHLRWARENQLDYQLALGRNYKAMLAAAADGKSTYELIDGSFRAQAPLARRREELDMPPDVLFKHITAATLVLAGERDLNVPPTHAARAVEIMRKAGNENATSRLIAGADHSFQQTPDDQEQRFRDRHSLASFLRPYEPAVYKELLTWLHITMPTPAEGTTRVSGGAGASPATRLKANAK